MQDPAQLSKASPRTESFGQKLRNAVKKIMKKKITKIAHKYEFKEIKFPAQRKYQGLRCMKTSMMFCKKRDISKLLIISVLSR